MRRAISFQVSLISLTRVTRRLRINVLTRHNGATSRACCARLSLLHFSFARGSCSVKRFKTGLSTANGEVVKSGSALLHFRYLVGEILDSSVSILRGERKTGACPHPVRVETIL